MYKKAELVCDCMAAWYDKVSLTMNAKKTEVICFGFASKLGVGVLVKGE